MLLEAELQVVGLMNHAGPVKVPIRVVLLPVSKRSEAVFGEDPGGGSATGAQPPPAVGPYPPRARDSGVWPVGVWLWQNTSSSKAEAGKFEVSLSCPHKSAHLPFPLRLRLPRSRRHPWMSLSLRLLLAGRKRL